MSEERVQALVGPVGGVGGRMEADEPFRIRVNLQRYFSDERARCYLMVSAARTGLWLEERLRVVFGLRGALRLLSGGYLLPPDEPLAVLRRDDLVDVIPVEVRPIERNPHGGHSKSVSAPASASTSSAPVTATATSETAAPATPATPATPAPTPTPATPDPTPPSDDAPQPSVGDTVGDDSEDCAAALQQSKRRALSLLERLDTGEPAPRRRRRVHCRRRRRPAPAPDPEPAPAPAPESTPAPAPAPAPAPEPGDVVRGQPAPGDSRSPRRVPAILQDESAIV